MGKDILKYPPENNYPEEQEDTGYVDRNPPKTFVAARISQNLADLCDQILDLCERGKLPYQYRHRSDVMKAALHTYCMDVMKKNYTAEAGITHTIKLLQKHQQHEAMMMDLRDSVKSFIGILQDHITDGQIDRALKLLKERLDIGRKIDDPYWKKRHEAMLFEGIPQVLKDKYTAQPLGKNDSKSDIIEMGNNDRNNSSPEP